jgi:hypothetical protein
MFLERFLNAMTKNIKIHNILDISKFMEPNKYIYLKKIMKMFISVFLMIFQNFDGSKKIKV